MESTHASNKVVWYEGMTLDPQHFQQWDRYHHDVVNARIRGLSRLDWGWTRLVIDTDRLANGELAVTDCAGVLPDGHPFDLPDGGPLPTPRPLSEVFPSSATQLQAYLAIPAENPGRSLVQRAPGGDGHPGPPTTRFVAAPMPLRDDNTGADERPVEVARMNVQVRFDGEPMEGYATLPMASIVREGGQFALDATYVPPVLTMQASSRLQAIARRILELLVAKSRALTEHARDAGRQREFSPAEVFSLGRLNVINMHVPLVQHHLGGASDHPEALYRTLASLAGGLAAYAPDGPAPQEVPSYDHSRPSDGLNALFAHLDNTLREAKASSNYTRIPLETTRENLRTASLTDVQVQERQLFLAARSERRSEDRLVADLPRMLRVASPSNIDQVLGLSIMALRIEATRRLPPGMPVDERASYFRLLKTGPFWEAIAQEEALSIFIPSEFSDVTFDLLATN